jgi:hypothetical protein
MDCEDEFAPQGLQAAGQAGCSRALCATFLCCRVHPPLFDHHLSLLKRVKDLSIQLLLPQLSVKALTVAALPRTSWLAIRHTCFACGIFCLVQLCHFEGALGSCFTLSLSLAPACCTERIDFSRWSIQLSASSSDTKETQKEKDATTIRLPVFAGLGVRKRPTPGACSDWLDIIRRQKSRIAHQRCKAEESLREGPRRACADSPLTTESEAKLPPERTLTRRPAR